MTNSDAGNDRLVRRLIWLGLLIAAVTRAALMTSKPFWRDEAWAAGLVEQPWDSFLAAPRVIPIGFLALTKLSALLPGLPPEIAYRLVPWLCGLGALVAVWRLARALGVSASVAATALWLGAGLPALIYYSRELKHYSIDLLLAALVPLLTLRVFGRDASADGAHPPSALDVVALLVTLTIAPWISFGSAFAIAATLAWGWAVGWRNADPSLRLRWGVGSLLYTASFVTVYVWMLRPQGVRMREHPYWRPHLFALHGLPTLAQTVSAVYGYFNISLTYLFPTIWPIVIPLLILGALTWPRPQRAALWWWTAGTALLTTGAALADQYVLAQGRLLLFTAVTYLLLVSAGLTQISRWLKPWLGRAAAYLPLAIAIAVCMVWSSKAMLHRIRPYHHDLSNYFLYDTIHEVEPLITYTAQVVEPGDAVLASNAAGNGFRYYARGRLPQATSWYPPRSDPEVPAAMREWLASVDRHGWIIMLPQEDLPWLRKLIAAAGFEHRQAAAARGAVLWELTRRQ